VAHQAGREAEDHLLSNPVSPGLPELAARVQALALEQSVSIATAESCTGGLVGHSITTGAGSSAFYLGGVVSYADSVKVDLLGVPAATIKCHGAVSAQVAVAMAEGVRARIGSDYGAAVTGVAGPGGGTEAKPVGLTYVAVAGPDGHDVRRYIWDDDRAANKESSAAAVLRLLLVAVETSAVPRSEPGT
jgi:PncC family amidohydrolase